MKRYMTRIALICMLVTYCLPLTAMAAGSGEPPREPYEKVASKNGAWYNERISYDGRSNLVIGYTGDYTVQAAEPVLEFSLSEKILLTGVYVPYAGMDNGQVELTIVDSLGNVYQGFTADPTYTLKESSISSNNDPGKNPNQNAVQERNTLFLFTPEYDIALSRGTYSLFLDGYELPVDAYLIKGFNYASYQRYLEELQKWAWEDEAEEEEMYAIFGTEDLRSLFEEYEDYEDYGEEDEYEHLWQSKPQELYAPMFRLDGTYIVDEILLDTWNDGRGEKPGEISILNEAGNKIFSFKAQGAGIADVPNAIWSALPGVTLPAGLYYLDMTAPDAMTYDENGDPVFYVGLSAPAAPMTNFTGTYKIWLDLYKTHTLMGPVSDKESSFSLEDYELSVLDKGAFIELMGRYEGMPFSQNCEVIEREENLVIAEFNFAADLTKLPYSANIAATAQVTLQKESNGRITVGMTGKGFYARAATKERGADENTYDLTLRGGRVKKDLPPFVMAAITKAYGAGNIPGPDTPLEAAVGMLFPPLVGLVVSALQGLLRPELITKLSVGEQSMKDANRSLGRGLYTEEEARAWATMGDALGASGGDAEDALSIGDNERPGGADYTAPQHGGRTDGFGAEYVGPDEDLSFGKPDATEDARGYTPQGQGEPPYGGADMPLPAEPESMVIQTSARGAQTLIVRDPATGGWVNAETGNPFDLETHQKNFPQQAKELEDFIKHNQQLERTGQTAMQQSLDEISRKEREGFNTIQKEIDQRWREQLAREQESLEWEQEHARKLSGWGRIIGDTVRFAGDDVVVATKTLGKDAKDAVVRTGQALGTVVGTLVYDPDEAIKKVREGYDSAKKYLGTKKDEVVGKAKEIYNKPWIAVRGVMETGKAVVDTVTDPKKLLGMIKESVGLEDFEKSLDPNLSLVDRMKHTFAGTMKLGVTIGTAGQGGTAVKSGVGKLGGMVDDVFRAGSKKLMTKAPIRKGIKTSLVVKRGPNYVAVKRSPQLAGVSKTTRKIIQNTADDMGVQFKARTIKSANAGKMIDAGEAVPKRMNMKAKTLSIGDEMLGGPKYSEGMVGYYDPVLPPKDVWKTLSQKTKEELVDLYKTRRREFRNLADSMKELQAAGEYRLEKGLVYDLKQGGKRITSDLDLHDVVNFDGSPVKESIKKQAYEQAMNYGQKINGKPPVQSTVMHEGTMSWTKESDLLHFDEETKQKLIDGATKEGSGKGIVSFNPHAKPTAEKYVR